MSFTVKKKDNTKCLPWNSLSRKRIYKSKVFFKQESKKTKVSGVMYENITLHQYCLEVMITELKIYFEVSIIPDHNCQKKKKNSSVRSENVNFQKIKKEKFWNYISSKTVNNAIHI